MLISARTSLAVSLYRAAYIAEETSLIFIVFLIRNPTLFAYEFSSRNLQSTDIEPLYCILYVLRR